MPSISTISPSTFDDGKPVTLTGSGFGSSTGQVLIGGVAQNVNTWSDDEITFTTVRGSQSLGACRVDVVRSAGFSGGTAALGWSAASLSDGQTLTITTDGTYNFGAGPTIALFEDFSASTSGQVIATSSPVVGDWYSVSGTKCTDVDSHIPGGKSAYIANTDTGTTYPMVFGVADVGGEHGLLMFQEVYAAFSIKDLGNFPGTNGTTTAFSTVSSTKDLWMMLGNRGDNTSYSVGTLNERSGHDLYLPGWSGSSFVIAGNETQMSPSWSATIAKNGWNFGGWNTLMFHGKLNASDPYGSAEGFFSFLGVNGLETITRSGNLMVDQTSEGVPLPYWDRLKFGSYILTGNAPVKRLYSDFYVAIGSSANARVIATNTSDLTSATVVHHLRPTGWTSNSVNVVVPSWMGSGTWYLRLIKADNTTLGPLTVSG